MSAFDTDIEVSPSIPWGPAWLDRTLPQMLRGTQYVHEALALGVVGLSLASLIRTWKFRKQLKQNPSNRPAIMKQIDKRVIASSRGYFYIANIYMLCTFFIAGVDAYIAAVSMKDDVHDHTEIWTPAFVLELAGLTAGLLVLFMAVFVFVPFLQVCASYWLLTRFARKKGETTLARYILEARAWSTSAALMWSMTCFLFQAQASPTEGGIWRWVFLQGAVGSAVAWLDASYAFTFCAHRLEDQQLELTTTGVRDVVVMFRRTVVMVHAKGTNATLLPKHETVTEETLLINEKASA